MWFGSWDSLLHVPVTGAMMFVALLVSIRLAGSRALSNMNASDFIVTVAIGTTFASTMLSSDIPVASGLAAIVTLIGIQAFTVWLSVKSPRLRHRAEGEPVVLLHDGLVRQRALECAHVSMDELRQAVRQAGHGGFQDIAVVLLEANGNFSVIPRANLEPGDALPKMPTTSGARRP